VTHSRAALRSLLDDRGLAPRRDLGQNFMVDANTVRRIASLAGVESGTRVVEIGAGLGSLTLALVEHGALVTAVEVDPGLAGALRDITASIAEVTVVEGDAMRLDWETVLAGHDEWVLVANLPYNVATPLVCDLLDTVPRITRMLVLVQDEAADRFCAGPGSKQYGAVSVKVAHHATARKVGQVPATVFLPRPNVESALVAIERRSDPAADGIDTDAMFHLVRTAFGQRRKMLRRSLGGVVDADTFAAAGIDPSDRPERLGLHDWYRLTRAVAR
jgi:16S rRNA (adenine1518-N6/adenine1519-N6)-dimethyltransferase